MGRKHPGIEVRGTSIRITFFYRGVRYRETIKIQPTPANLKYVERWRQTILHEIGLGRFDYARHFPDSPHARTFKPGFRVTVAEALEDWLKAARRTTAYSTWEDYCNSVRRHLIPAFGALKLCDLTTVAIKTWIGQLECSAKRVNNLLIPLRGMLGDAYEDGAIERNPMTRIRNSKATGGQEPDPFTPDEVSRILAACDGQVRNLWRFAFATGLRTGELLALNWEDIDITRGTVYIRRSVVRGLEQDRTKTKAGKREVVLLPPAIEALRQQKEHSYLHSGRIFLNPLYSEPWKTPHELSRIAWQPTLRRAKVRYRNPYQTRHTYASMLLTAGEDPMWVAQQMGHKDWGMIRRVYGRWIPQARPEAGARAAKLMGQNWGTDGTTQASLGQNGARKTRVFPGKVASPRGSVRYITSGMPFSGIAA